MTMTGSPSTSDARETARALFLRLADEVARLARPHERWLAWFEGEDSDFARLNRGRVRQAGRVEQRALTVDLIDGERHAAGEVSVGCGAEVDRAALARLVDELRAVLPSLPPDPHLLYSEDAASTERDDPDLLPEPQRAIAEVVDAAAGGDLVGIWASGSSYAGCATSFGQRSWHAVRTFNLDWSSCDGERAVKRTYAGTRWDAAEFRARLASARTELAALARPPVPVAPGRYRSYLAPAALEDLLGMLCWGGFSAKETRARTSPLLRLSQGEVALSPAVTLVEDRESGFCALATPAGFRKQPRVPLVERGRWSGPLVSPRSAKEFGLETNSGGESPEALSMDAGELPAADAAARIGDGLWIGNLWYCNYSDRNACRVTGMTRYACFAVRGGEIAGPLPAMRFDDSLYGVLGERLLGLTRERERLLSASSYGSRSTASSLVPGALVADFALVL